jgi:hypothetical protein
VRLVVATFPNITYCNRSSGSPEGPERTVRGNIPTDRCDEAGMAHFGDLAVVRMNATDTVYSSNTLVFHAEDQATSARLFPMSSPSAYLILSASSVFYYSAHPHTQHRSRHHSSPDSSSPSISSLRLSSRLHKSSCSSENSSVHPSAR